MFGEPFTEDYGEVTAKAKEALEAASGSTEEQQQGDEIIYRVHFPKGTIPLPRVKRTQGDRFQLPTGVILAFDGSELIDDGQSYPLYVLRRPGRPKERDGDYEKIALEVRKDLLRKMDASGKSRRQYIEDLILNATPHDA